MFKDFTGTGTFLLLTIDWILGWWWRGCERRESLFRTRPTYPAWAPPTGSQMSTSPPRVGPLYNRFLFHSRIFLQPLTYFWCIEEKLLGGHQAWKLPWAHVFQPLKLFIVNSKIMAILKIVILVHHRLSFTVLLSFIILLSFLILYYPSVLSYIHPLSAWIALCTRKGNY